MLSNKKIDEFLLANVTKEWRKVAFVVGVTMMQVDESQRRGLNDIYFADRVAVLVHEGLVDYRGDLRKMRHCEIRLSEN